MKKRLFQLLVFVFCITCIQAIAQDTADKAPANLSEAFSELKSKSTDYEDYEVVKKFRLENFWKQINDTITAKDNAYKETLTEIKSLKTQIKDMTASMEQKEQQVVDSQYLVDHLKFLGISINKDTYVFVNIFIILVLAAVIGIGFGRFKENERVTTTKKKEAVDAEEELEDYKRKSKEKEMKLRRELQTEINKNEELSKEIIQLKKKKTT
ncbi:hypothetical protein [Chondrinema litorale]|uniref:hypothetical protein n=1 Tax=Chondrinema litorale TaxID=2994555 RepID=UPI002542F73F|nr:hypothetical protein [Chondrinema litorale]UZR92858.1 hypothetical protein OQ292_13435 [Chondrinema litorale]